jgi:hypothetical protein
MKVFLQYASIYILILMTSSLIYPEYMEIFFLINIFISIIIFIKYRLFINKNDMTFIFILSTILIFLFWYTNGGISIQSIINTITTIFFTSLYFKFNREDFINKYINIISVIAIISIIGYISDITNTLNIIIDKLPSLINSNPILGNPKGGLIYVFRNINKINQNCGFCYEPGKYQFFINLAIYFILFCRNTVKMRKFKFTILLITLATTMSTTGLLMGVVIVILSIFKKNIFISKRYILVMFMIVCCICLIFFYERINLTLFQKLNFDFRTFTFEYGSGNTRINDIKLDLEIFSMNIWGNGWVYYKDYWSAKQYGNYLYTTGSSSNSLTSMFAVYGIVFSIYINYKYIHSFFRKSNDMLMVSILIFMYLYQNLSQSFSLMPMMIIFILSNNELLYGRENN